MRESSIILGISAFYHDSAAALLIDGELIGAAQEERFTRKKHDASFPKNAIEFVLDQSGLSLSDLETVAFYDKPYIKFERLLETYHSFAPKGISSFWSSMPVWIKEKLFLKKLLRDEFKKIGVLKSEFIFPEHHLSHAASAFYPSPYEEAAILTLDGVGEWTTTAIGHGKSNKISILKEVHFPHSLGLLYSAFTYYLGFRVNSGEYKLMGLAPYGDPETSQTKEFKRKILENLVDVRNDGSFLLNMEYFNFATGLTMTNDKMWARLFNTPRRNPLDNISNDAMNLALAIQEVTEEIILKLSQTAYELTNCKQLVLAGGVALNCVANGKLLKSGIFDDIWIQPAAGDAGGAIGAAYSAWHISKDMPRYSNNKEDKMNNCYLGPTIEETEVSKIISKYGACTSLQKGHHLLENVVNYLKNGKVIGWVQGKMEFGPRALCNRSIIGDPRQPDMQKKLNLKIKYREGFRPFAPVTLEESASEYFDINCPSPYMLLVAPLKKELRKFVKKAKTTEPIMERLRQIRSDLPAITHVDYSARVQTVNAQSNPKFSQLLKHFYKETGCKVLVNTSFNVRGEPIVCDAEDAYRCFMRTEMDILVIGDYIFKKEEQPVWGSHDNWKEEFILD